MFATSNARTLLPESGIFTSDEVRQATGAIWRAGSTLVISVALTGVAVFMLANAF